MRILQIGPIPPEVSGQTAGGVASHLWGLAAYLVKAGHTVGVLGDNYTPQDLSPEMEQGIHLFGFQGLSDSLSTGYLFCPSFWLKLIRTKNHFGSLMSWKAVLTGLLNYHRVIKAFEPELIHVHHLEFRFPLAHYLVGNEIPILTTVHSTSFLERSPTSAARERKEFIRRNLHLARNLIFVSQFLKQRFEVLFPGVMEDKKAVIIHNPVNGSLYHPISKKTARETLGLKPAGSLLLFVGKLIPHKRLDILMEAGRILQDRGLDFRILVVGSGPEQTELEGLVEKSKLNDRAHFSGLISQEKLFLYYNAADLCILPSAVESFGLVFVEAMLCGCPVLGRAEVLKEILPSERCGVHIPSPNPARWADEIAKALERSWSQQEIHELSRVYTWEGLGPRFEEVYKQITI